MTCQFCSRTLLNFPRNTGMIKKSSGRIVINDASMKNSGNIAHAIGLCPQYNLFFPDLTVAEHLEFFARVRNIYYRKPFHYSRACS